MIYEIFTVIAPVLLIAAAGFMWDRYQMPFDTDMVSRLVTAIGAPCLVFGALISIRPDPETVGLMAFAAVLVVAVTAAISIVILKLWGLQLSVYLPALIFPNSGNMGLPLVLFAFGESGLALAVAFFATIALIQFSLGIYIASGSASVRGVLQSPVFLSAVGGLAVVMTEAPVPLFAENTITVMGDLTIPLMLLALGISLSRLQVSSVGRAATLAVGRLALGVGVGFLIAFALGLEGEARGAVIIQSAMPAAVFNYLFALRYDNEPGEVAGLVVVSTALSFLTLPLLLAVVL